MGCVYVMQSRQLSRNIANLCPDATGRLIKVGSADCLFDRVRTMRGGRYKQAHAGQLDWRVWRYREVQGVERWRWETLEFRMHFALQRFATSRYPALRRCIGDFDPHKGVRTELFLIPTGYDIAEVAGWFDGDGGDLPDGMGTDELQPLPKPESQWYPGCNGHYIWDQTYRLKPPQV